MTRRAILNVGTGHRYPLGQQRLFDTLQERDENATRLFWRDEYPPGSPTHEQVPYAFKPHAFLAALELGFDQALWMDASCWLLKPIDLIWELIGEHGYYLEPDGHLLGEWISDACLGIVELTRDEALRMPLIEGKLIGLDLRDPVALDFLHGWVDLAARGGFQGDWTNEHRQVSSDPRCRGHRHDISCGSPLADSLGMRVRREKLVWFPDGNAPPEHALIGAQGM